MAVDTRRSTYARRALSIAERTPMTSPQDPLRAARVRQAAVTVERAARSERTTDGRGPK